MRVVRMLGVGALVVLVATFGLVLVKGSGTVAAAAPTSGPVARSLDPLPAIGDLASGLAQDSAATMLDVISNWVASGTGSLITALATVINNQTTPDLEAGWLDGHYATMAYIALLLSLPLIFATAITAIVRQDAGPLIRAVAIQLPIAAVGTTVAIDLVNLGLATTDELCALVTSNTANDANSLLLGLSQLLNKGVPGAGGFGLVIVCILVACGAFFLTLEMIVRSAAVYVAMLFLPLALAGLLWPPTARWGRRLAETLAALILSKFVVVAIISMAVAAVGAGISGGGLSGLLAGAALLLLAGAAPFTLLRMVPIVEAGMMGHLEGAGGRASAPLQATQQKLHERLFPDGGGGASGADPQRQGGQGLATQASERGLAEDMTQAGADKPVPAGAGSAGGAGGGGIAGAAEGAGAGGAGAAATAVGAVAAPLAVGAVAVDKAHAVAGRVEGAADATSRLSGGGDG